MRVIVTSVFSNITKGATSFDFKLSDLDCGDGVDVSGIITLTDRLFPGFKDKLYVHGKLNRFVNIFLNQEDIRFLQHEDTRVNDNDTVSFIPAISGG